MDVKRNMGMEMKYRADFSWQYRILSCSREHRSVIISVTEIQAGGVEPSESV